MHKPWYQLSQADLQSYFDVKLLHGLNQSEALKRLSYFGKNYDPKLPAELQNNLKANVIRSGESARIAIKQLAPGDVVLLRPGDRVPADIRLLHVNGLTINQQIITGESMPSTKFVFAIQSDVPPSQQKCMAFAGSIVVNGTGKGIVVGRGQETLLAKSIVRRRNIGLRGSVIARRLRRYGVIVISKRILANFRSINTVVCDFGIQEDAEIIDILRKVQLTRGIECKFVLPEYQARRLAHELQADIYDASSREGVLSTAQFIINLHTDTDNSLHIASTLKSVSDRCLLWASSGNKPSLGASVANITLTVGNIGRDDVILQSGLFAPNSTPLLLTRILYNKK